MNQEQMEAVIISQVEPFNKTGNPVTTDTILEEVLQPASDLPGVDPQRLVHDTTRWAIHHNGDAVKDWGTDWPTLSVSDLAKRLIIIILFFVFAIAGHSQTKVNLSVLKTKFQNSAFQIGVNYVQSLDSLYGGKEQIFYGKSSVLSFLPEFDIEGGSPDALSSITAKVTGLATFFKTKVVSGITVPDLNRTFSAVPISIGLETSQRFSFINGVVEVGYTPWFGPRDKDVFKHLEVGVYLQGGYKQKIWNDTTTVGNQVDQSSESLNNPILRFRGNLAVDSKQLFHIGMVGFGFSGTITSWYDVINRKVYDMEKGTLDVFTGKSSQLNFGIDHGSGAPLYNGAVQYTAGLSFVLQ